MTPFHDLVSGDLVWVMDDLHGPPITMKFKNFDFRLATGEWYVSGIGADGRPMSVPVGNVIALKRTEE